MRTGGLFVDIAGIMGIPGGGLRNVIVVAGARGNGCTDDEEDDEEGEVNDTDGAGPKDALIDECLVYISWADDVLSSLSLEVLLLLSMVLFLCF